MTSSGKAIGEGTREERRFALGGLNHFFFVIFLLGFYWGFLGF